MTINIPGFPGSRNSFHFAWLLLILPPLASLGMLWWDQNSPEYLAQAVRLSLTLLAVLPLLWMRSGPVGMRMQRLLKESRVLLPGCLLAVLVPGLLTMTGQREAGEWAVFCYGFGCLLMGAALFGGEFEQRTMATLLGQPLSRGVLYAEKLGPLALLLAFATLNLFLSLAQVSNVSYGSEELGELLLVPLFALCSGPLFSLVSRSTLAALIFTAAVPMVVFLFGLLGLQMIHRLGHPGEPFPDDWGMPLLWIGIPAYLVITAVLSWRSFRNLEVRDGGAGGRSSTGLHPLSWPVDAVLGRLLPASGATGQLIRKELRLHVVPWLVASLMVGLWLLWLLLRHFAKDEGFRGVLNEVSAMTVFAALLGLIIVVGTGAASVAEERELGTLEWQLTQSVPVRRQWAIKVAVTMALSIGLGILLPALLLWLGFSREQLAGEFGEQFGRVGASYAALFFMGLATSIYASSISRNTMKATAAAVGLASGFAGVVAAVAASITANLDQAFVNLPEKWEAAHAGMPSWAPSQELMTGLSLALLAVIVLGFVSGLLWLGGWNCRRQVVPARDVVRQFVGMSLGLVALLAVCGAIAAQLMALKQQEGWYQQLQGQRETLLATLQHLARSGKLPSETYRQFNVPVNAPAETLADAIIESRGSNGAYELARALNMRATSLEMLQSLARSGKLTPETYRQFDVPTNAPVETLADAIIKSRGPYGLNELVRKLTPPAKSAGMALDPAMVRRYGLVPGTLTAKTNAVAPQEGTNPAPAVFLMDPVMARRYGLPIPTNAPSPEAPVPASPGK
jgi:hypothetical protein